MGATEEAGDRHDDALAERFFSEAPPAWEIEHEDWQSEPLTSLERLAILITVAPLLSVVVVGLTLLLFSAPITSAKPKPVAAAQVLPIPMPPEPEVEVAEVALQAPPAPVAQLTESAPIATAEPQVKEVQLVPPEAPPSIATRAAPRAVASVARKRTAGDNSALVRARKALSAGDAVSARMLAEAAIQEAPEKAAAYIVLAGALDQLGHRAGKNAAFRACVEQAKDALASACRTLMR